MLGWKKAETKKYKQVTIKTQRRFPLSLILVTLNWLTVIGKRWVISPWQLIFRLQLMVWIRCAFISFLRWQQLVYKDWFENIELFSGWQFNWKLLRKKKKIFRKFQLVWQLVSRCFLRVQSWIQFLYLKNISVILRRRSF